MTADSNDMEIDPRAAGSGWRLKEGGALLSDMREMVCGWSDVAPGPDSLRLARQVLTKSNSARRNDVFNYAFKPRFLLGNPPEAWRLARALEDAAADIDVIRPFYFWITARAEPLLHAFASDVVFRRRSYTGTVLGVDDVISWVGSRTPNARAWTHDTRRRVARALLATLRDFGILEGQARKRTAAFHLPPQAVALISFCLQEAGASSGALLGHPDWEIFLLDTPGVERLLMECHQHKWLGYHAAGNIVRIELPRMSFGEYVNVVIGRTPRVAEK